MKAPAQDHSGRADLASSQQRLKSSAGPQADSRKARILIVDDDPEIRRFSQRVLESLGFQCEQAQTGLVALQAADRTPFDLVLLDIDMPEMTGLQALPQLRERGSSPRNLKIIMCSGGANCDEMARMLASGADDYIGKPFSPVQLRERVRAGLRLKELQDRSDMLKQHLLAVNSELERAYEEMETANAALQREINERKLAEELARQAHAENERLLAAIPSILIGLDGDGTVAKWNKVAEEVFAIPCPKVRGRPFDTAGIAWEDKSIIEHVLASRHQPEQTRFEDVAFVRPDGQRGFLSFALTPIPGSAGMSAGILLLGSEITERRHLEIQLAHAQKLESIGQLAAGIAHEINTPIQYVGDNTNFLQDAFGELQAVLQGYESLLTAAKEAALTEDLIAKVAATVDAADVSYLAGEIPRAIRQSLDGVESVTKIVRAMKEFSHPGGEEKSAVDINHAIENTITVARNEWKCVAEIVRDFDDLLPPVCCLPGELNQVILNLIINAAHAVEERLGERKNEKGTITVTTQRRGDEVEIRISDTGCGIPDAIRSRVYDPFFTTKAPGKGTGQGLAIAHAVVVKKHGGTITFETEAAKGTTFIIRLPINS